jgi:hypothetical protein
MTAYINVKMIVFAFLLFQILRPIIIRIRISFDNKSRPFFDWEFGRMHRNLLVKILRSLTTPHEGAPSSKLFSWDYPKVNVNKKAFEK